MNRFKDNVVIVTGSSSGIGRDAAIAFAKEGASVTLHGRSLERLEETEKLILDVGVPSGKILTIQGRIENEETQRNLVDETVKEFGKIDVLINNAGAVMKANTDPESLENYDFLFNVNLRSVVALTQLAVPHLEKTRGNIVNVSTVGSTRLLPHATFYACSKAALDHYTRHCALLYGSKGIRVNGINPGPVETSVYSRHNPPEDVQLALYNWIKDTTIIKRCGVTKEVTPTILLLASDEASYITGVNWLIDGGMNVHMPMLQFKSST